MLQPRADDSQQPVAGFVAERVVDLLEAVEIEEYQRQRGFSPASARHGLQQAVVEQPAIGKAGDRIELRDVGQALLDPVSADGGTQCGGDRLEKIRVFSREIAVVAPVRTQDSKGSVGRRVSRLRGRSRGIAPAGTRAASAVRPSEGRSR